MFFRRNQTDYFSFSSHFRFHMYNNLNLVQIHFRDYTLYKKIYNVEFFILVFDLFGFFSPKDDCVTVYGYYFQFYKF